jgi:transposase
MSRKAKAVNLSDAERKELTKMSNSRAEPHQNVIRATIVLLCGDGMQIKDIALQLSETPVTIRKWRDRYLDKGLAGLSDMPRNGAPVLYGDDFKKQVLDTLGTPPPNGLSYLSKLVKSNRNMVWYTHTKSTSWSQF